MKLNYGDAAARKVSERMAEAVATMAALVALPASRCVNGMVCHVLADGSMWQFNSSCALTGDNILVAEPSDGGAGAWLRMPGGAMLVLPFVFGTSDAAILLTLPTGCVIQATEFAWRIGTGFSGGTASTIGISSTNHTGHTTKGDLLGGATGDAAATLVSGDYIAGTIGTTFDTIADKRVFLKAADTLRFDRITSAFTAGSGSALVACNVLKNLGA